MAQLVHGEDARQKETVHEREDDRRRRHEVQRPDGSSSLQQHDRFEHEVQQREEEHQKREENGQNVGLRVEDGRREGEEKPTR